MISFFAGPRVALVGLAGCLFASHTVLGQFKDVAQYGAIVTADSVSLRCGDGLYYKVADLSKGQIVQVDGESAQWVRVLYPAGTPAFVKAEQAKADEAAGTVKLSAPSQLQAVHLAGGFNASWKAVMPTPLPEGTTLKLLDKVTDGATVLAYKVVAPPGAKGFVESKYVRKATPEELAPPKAPEAKPAEPKAAEPKATDPKSTDKPATESKPTEPKAAEPTAVTPGEGTPAEAKPQPTPLMDPLPGETPQGQTPPTVEINQKSDAGTATPAAEPKPAERQVGTLEQLEATFNAVRRESPESAEYEALLTELQRAIDTAASSPDGSFRKQQLQRRYDFIKLKMDARDEERRYKAALQAIDESTNRVRQKIADLERQRVYTIIGLLVPSTVYDGKRLPLMYRLQAVGVTAPPTVGYLKPAPELQLESKLGMVVGVVGDTSIDRSLMLNVVTPIRVDVLQGVDGQTMPITQSGTGEQR